MQSESEYIEDLFTHGNINPDKTVKYSALQQWIRDYHPEICIKIEDIRKKIIKHNLGRRTTDMMNYRIDNIAAIDLYRDLNDNKFPSTCCEQIIKLICPSKKYWSEYDYSRPINLHLYNLISKMRQSLATSKENQIHRAVKSYVISCERSDHHRVIGHSFSILSSSSGRSKSYKIAPGVFPNEACV